MIRIITLTLLLLVSAGNLAAQESIKVTMKLTYKGAPLCFWDVTIKHGDLVLDQGKTDENGFVDFGYVKLMSYGIDASGYKKTANGDKNWDVKGYIALNEQGHADFDFQPLVEEMGMGSLIEAAWGLTLNDCGGGSGTSTGSTSNSTTSTTSSDTGTGITTETTSTTSSNTGTGTTTEKSTLEQWEEESALKEAERKKEQEQWQQDWESGKTTAEGYQNQHAMYADKVESLTRKIGKKTEERNAVKPDSREYSDLSYDIRDLEIERSVAELKLEKTDKEIANGNAPLNKTERDYYKEKEDALKNERDALKEKRDSGVRFNADQQAENTTLSEGETEEEPEKYVVYSAEEFASMNTLSLQKLKLEYQTKLGKRKTVLKTQSSIMKDDKRAMLEKEIAELEKMIELMETELANRKDKQ